MLTRLLKASNTRKSRLHDEQGNLVSCSRLIFNGPRAISSGTLRIALGVRPKKPWISYSATRRLAAFLDKDKTVLEFGSGMSTLWYAKRAGKVVSIESSKPWYDNVSRMLKRYDIRNVDYYFAPTDDDYVRVPEEHGCFDLVMVDGKLRDRCTAASLDKLSPGGIFYLDNSDRMASPDSAEARAVAIVQTYAEKHGCSINYYTDFAPTQFFAQQGMLLHRPA